MAREVIRRDELEEPYARPYRTLVPRAITPMRPRATLTVGAGAAVAGGAASLFLGSGVAIFGLLVLVLAIGVVAWWALVAAREVFRLTRVWAEPNVLEDVRRARPHRGNADPAIAHDEFAVTVEDDGLLCVWRFRPLPVWDNGAPDEVRVPGRPQHTARVVDELPLHPRDQVRAAEQLAAAQDRAAELEAEAIADAHRRLARQEARAELEAETASTAAALQHLTGQRRSRRS
jgi:hypothetical protein